VAEQEWQRQARLRKEAEDRRKAADAQRKAAEQARMATDKARRDADKARRDAEKARLRTEADKAKGAAGAAATNKKHHFWDRAEAQTRARSAREEISILNSQLRGAKGAERARLQQELAKWRRELDTQQRNAQQATNAARKESQAMDDYAALARRIEERRRRLEG
jgi:hypothetical protein